MWLFLVTVLAEVNLDIAFSIFLDTAQPQASLSAISSNAIFHQFLGGLDKHAETLICHTQGSTNNKDIFVYPNRQSTRSNQSDGSNGKVVTHTRHTNSNHFSPHHVHPTMTNPVKTINSITGQALSGCKYYTGQTLLFKHLSKKQNDTNS